MNNTKQIILSSDVYDDSLQTLKKLGYEVIYSFENKNVSTFLRKHVDMQLVRINDMLICAPECYDYYKQKNFGDLFLIKGDTTLSSNYPDDIAYNINIGDEYAVHNFDYTDSAILSHIKDKTFINVSQGYTSCCLCRIGSDVYITSDCGIYKNLKKYDCEVLLISIGNILLPGFDYGFFGGSSFMISENELAINGNIRYHPDAERIVRFCDDHNVTVVSLSDKPIMDIGSGVLL